MPAAANRGHGVRSSKSWNGKRGSSSARTSSRPGRPTCESTVLVCRPVFVGDPGEKRPARRQGGHRDGPLPLALQDGEGVITEVLGPRGQPGVDTLSIIREFGLPERFAADALEEARQQADAFDESIGDRLDLTGETIITIDPADAGTSTTRFRWNCSPRAIGGSVFTSPTFRTSLVRAPPWTARRWSGPRASICPIACCRCCRK